MTFGLVVRLPPPPTAVTWLASQSFDTLAERSSGSGPRRGARCGPVDDDGGVSRGTGLVGALRDLSANMRPKSSAKGWRHRLAQRQLLQFGAQLAMAKRHSLRRRGGPRLLGRPPATQKCGQPRNVHRDLPQHASEGGIGQARAERLHRRRQKRHRRRRAEAVDIDNGGRDHAHDVYHQPPQAVRAGDPRNARNVQRLQSG